MDANTKDILEAVNFIKDNMATKDDVTELSEQITELDTRLSNKIDNLDTKFNGLNSRIDYELDKRLGLEVRVKKLEEKVGV